MKNSKLSTGIFKSEGFGLLEALTAVAVLGVISIGLISQQKLSIKSAFTIAADTEVNNITKKILSEISNEATCTLNFDDQNPTNTYTLLKSTFAGAPNPNILEVGVSYGVSDGANPDPLIAKQSRTSMGEIQVAQIETIAKSSREMTLRITFKRKDNHSILDKFNASTITRDIPLSTILKSTGKIKSCFGDYDMIAATAVEMACRGNKSFYEEPSFPDWPYGRCLHQFKNLTCPTGYFLKTVTSNPDPTGTNKNLDINVTNVSYTCVSFKEACPAGEFIKGFKPDGNPDCGRVYKDCAAGQVIVMNSTGQLVCSSGDCSMRPVLSALAGFDSTGTEICYPIGTLNTCGADNFATQINTNGSISCNPATMLMSGCPVGQRVTGINAAGNVTCAPYINIPFDCGGGAGFQNIDANGNPDCKPIDRPLACDGGQKNHSYNDCTAGGQWVAYGGTGNSQCVFNGPTCPGGWTRCYSFGQQTTSPSCLDTSNTFYCDGNRSWRNIAPTNGDWWYGNAGINSTPCYQWTGFPGTSHACYPYVNQWVSTVQQTVGCY